MEIDIKCMECGKGTRKFELGGLFYLEDKPSETVVVKNTIICPKCMKDISDGRCIVKTYDFMMSLITANLCRSCGDVPKHLRGAIFLQKKDYNLIKDSCKSRLNIAVRFNK